MTEIKVLHKGKTRNYTNKISSEQIKDIREALNGYFLQFTCTTYGRNSGKYYLLEVEISFQGDTGTNIYKWKETKKGKKEWCIPNRKPPLDIYKKLDTFERKCQIEFFSYLNEVQWQSQRGFILERLEVKEEE